MSRGEGATAASRRQREGNHWDPQHRYWTRDRILCALRAYVSRTTGPLPGTYRDWRAARDGDLELPIARVIGREFGSMSDAWKAAGAFRRRRPSKIRWPWSEADDEFLREQAGTLSYGEIASQLKRSEQSVRTRAGRLGVEAMSNQGWMTANEVARHFKAPITRVQRLLAAGTLKARRRQAGQYWAIDLRDALAIEDTLRAPKKTYLGTAPDVGDYHERYGLPREQRSYADRVARRGKKRGQ